MRAFRLLYAMALFVLQPLRCVALVGQSGRRYRGRQPDRDEGRLSGRDPPVRYRLPEEERKLRQGGERVFLGMVSGGFVEMESVSVDRYGWTVTLFCFV